MSVSAPAGTAIDAVPSPPFIAPAAARFADRRTGTRAHVAFCDRPAGRVGGRTISAIGGRPDVGPVADAEIVQNRARHDRHFGGSRLESDLPLVKVLAHARRDIEAERAAARQEDRMHLLHEIHWIQQIGFDRSGSRPAHIDAGHGAGFGKDDGAAGQPLRACDLADLDSGNVGDAAGRCRWS